MTSIDTGSGSNGFSNGSRECLFDIPSNHFKTSSFRFEVTRWPGYGCHFKEAKGKLHPYGCYQATYASRGATWVVGTDIAKGDGELTYYIDASKETLSFYKTGTSMNVLLKEAISALAIDVGKSQLSAPMYFCLDGQNLETKSVTVQGIFSAIQKGRRQSTLNGPYKNQLTRHLS